MALLRAELRREMGRRGSFFGCAAVLLLVGVGILIYSQVADEATGAKVIDSATGMLTFFMVLVAVLVGALAGSYDVDQGTMRYLVLTGVSRTKLALVRVPGVIVTLAVLTIPAYLIVLLAYLLVGGVAPGGGDWFNLFYQPLISGWIYGVIGLAIGMFLRSNGVAIAVALVLNFVGLLLAGLIAENVSTLAGELFIGASSGILIEHEAGDELSLAAAAVVTCIWLAALLAASVARVQRAEF